MDRHVPRPIPRTAPVGDHTHGAGSLSRSAFRRRRAQRAFEDRVRAMARRLERVGDDGGAMRHPLPRV